MTSHQNILSLPEKTPPSCFGNLYEVEAGTEIPPLRTAGRAAFIESGIVRLTARGGPHPGSLMGYRSSGWIVGDAFAGRSGALSLTATAVTRCIVRNTVNSAISPADREGLLSHLVAMYAWELEAKVHADFDLHARTPLERLAMILLEFAVRCGDEHGDLVRLEFPIRQVELAQYLRLSPEHVNRLTHRLYDEKIITELKWPALTLSKGAIDYLLK